MGSDNQRPASPVASAIDTHELASIGVARRSQHSPSSAERIRIPIVTSEHKKPPPPQVTPRNRLVAMTERNQKQKREITAALDRRDGVPLLLHPLIDLVCEYANSILPTIRTIATSAHINRMKGLGPAREKQSLTTPLAAAGFANPQRCAIYENDSVLVIDSSTEDNFFQVDITRGRLCVCGSGSAQAQTMKLMVCCDGVEGSRSCNSIV